MIKKEEKNKLEKQERLKPLSLYPLEVEEALGDILKVKPKGKKGNSDEKGDEGT